MHLSITQRLCPFSHLPGTAAILPGSTYKLEIFPCLIRIYSLTQANPSLLEEIPLNLQGPLKQFTVFCDLEQGKITVSGESPKGWIRYHLASSIYSNHILFWVDRIPENLSLFCKEQTSIVKCSDSFQIGEKYQPPIGERLSFGNYKSQDIELIKRRLDLTEIFPLWHRLGQLVPKIDYLNSCQGGGIYDLLQICRESLELKKPEEGKQKWLNLFQAGFKSLFVPCLIDKDYLGICSSSLHSSTLSPLSLLSECSALITQLYIHSSQGKISILPHLLPELHAGSLIGFQVKGVGNISLEWTKKTIRRMIIHSGENQELDLLFRSNVRSYRVRKNTKDPGERRSTHHPLHLEKDVKYLFDNFM